MKIDTSKLTPVQAQQIEAIASGIHFTLRHYTGTGIWNSPLSISMNQIQAPEHYDDLIEDHQAKLTDGSLTDPKEIESQHEHIAMLKRRRQGIAEWDCTFSIKSARYYNLPIHWKAGPHGDALLAKIRTTLSQQYGLKIDTLCWLNIDSTVTLESWQDVRAWHDRHSTLDNAVLAALVDSIVDEYLVTLSPIDRLTLKRGEVADRWAGPIHTIGRHYRKLKALLSKALDILRPKV